jgi:hypothetical protein
MVYTNDTPADRHALAEPEKAGPVKASVHNGPGKPA